MLSSRTLINQYLSEVYNKPYKGQDTSGQGTKGTLLVLNDILNLTRIPRTLTHLTPRSNVESILVNGLKDRGINRMGGKMRWSGIYLSNDPKLHEVEEFDMEDTAEVVVNTSSLNSKLFKFDYEFHGGDLLDSELYSAKGAAIEDFIPKLARDYSSGKKHVYMVYSGDIPAKAISIENKFMKTSSKRVLRTTSAGLTSLKLLGPEAPKSFAGGAHPKLPKGARFEIEKSHYTGGYYVKSLTDITVDGVLFRRGSKAIIFNSIEGFVEE